jgi:hypothetical protein
MAIRLDAFQSLERRGDTVVAGPVRARRLLAFWLPGWPPGSRS